MSNPLRVIVEYRSTPALAMTAFSPYESAAELGDQALPGAVFDQSFSPVPIPPSSQAGSASFAALTTPHESTYIVRATVDPDGRRDFLAAAAASPGVVDVYSDPVIEPIAVCPTGPIGTDIDVRKALDVDGLAALGLDGSGVRVAVVDSGINLDHLKAHGMQPHFDAELSWGPYPNQPLGRMPVSHGTMCAYDVCIAAPNCTLVDHALLTSNATGGSAMAGLLSDAVRSYATLLGYLTKAVTPFAGDYLPRTLVVNNSWGMFHPSWDFPEGSPQNYSANPNHIFTRMVRRLEAAGADILFAAGNCGAECPDGRCQGVTNQGIYGANSAPEVLSVAGVSIGRVRLGYSTKGPGKLEDRKPDIASFTHFAGSGVYAADGGTSAATPVAAGVVAAVRRLYPPSVVSPARLRELIRKTAGGGFDYETGYGILNARALVAALQAVKADHASGDGRRLPSAARAARTSKGRVSKKDGTGQSSAKRGGAKNAPAKKGIGRR